MQSHGGQVRHLADIPRWCDDVTDSASPTRFARRSLLRAAVLGRRDESDFSLINTDSSDAEGADRSLKYTVTGRILDVSPHILVLHTDRGEQRFPIAASAEARPGHPPAAPMVSGHVHDPVSGTAVWHEPGEDPVNLLGLAYPALDPETSCEHAASMPPVCPGDQNTVEEWAVDPHATGSGCVRLPYLSVGSLIRLRNDCAEQTRVVPVTSSGATARLFCDRCVTCGTSRKGRIADLTMAAFRGTRRRPR